MMARRFRRCSPLVFTISLLALLGSLFASVAQGEPDTRRPQTIGDMFWIWGNPELTEPGEHGYANFREASPAQHTRMLGATSPDGVHWTKANDGQPVTGLDGSPPHKAHIGLMEATLP